ncbi:MAG: hypothetical protein GC139_00185 [Sideroxydans sp.]|nr:hypothetical protein [Sideroxydans sp.]
MRQIYLKIIPVCALSICLIFSIADACALTAKILTLDVSGGQAINPQTDHFSLSVESGFISSKGGFSSIFYKARSATFVVRNNVNFQSGSPRLIEVTNTIVDPKSSMQRPLGFAGYIFPDIPGDISSTDLTVSISISNDPIVGKTLTALESNRAKLPAQIFSSPWIGYAQTISTLTDVFFGSDSNSTPISAHLILAPPQKEEYIVLIASGQDGDIKLNNLNASELTYDPQAHTLKFSSNGQAISDWTYIVFKLGYKPPINFDLLSLSSSAPWATVVNTQLRTIPLDQVNDRKQLQAISTNVLSSLAGLQNFLSADPIFSNYDRASGLHALASEKISDIEAFCTEKHMANCPVNALKQYQRGLEYAFNIDHTTLAIASKAIQFQNFAIASTRKTEAHAMPASVTLGGWRTFLRNNPDFQSLSVNKADKSIIDSLSNDIKYHPIAYKPEDIHQGTSTYKENGVMDYDK